MSPVSDHLAPALAAITARLVDEHDPGSVLDLVTRACVEVLAASAAGVLLADPRGGLTVAAATEDQTWLVELLQAHTEQGPCVECIDAGELVGSADLDADHARWPQFATTAVAAGYRAVHAVPMRLDTRTVGGLNLLYATPTTWTSWQRHLGRALADLAILGLSQERNPRRADLLVERTLTAVNDRVELAHAIGLIAGTLDIGVDQARTVLTDHARRTGVPVREVVRGLTTSTLDPTDLTETIQDR